MQYTYKYIIKENGNIVREGITTNYKQALNAFKGLGRYVYGSIFEYDDTGLSTEIAYKPFLKAMRRWK